jgi:hypothetical protein
MMIAGLPSSSPCWSIHRGRVHAQHERLGGVVAGDVEVPHLAAVAADQPTHTAHPGTTVECAA